MNRFITPIIFIIFSSAVVMAQTSLTAGDLAILGVNCDNPDDFAFLLLRDIDAGTVIKFTDNGWLAAGGFRGGEGIQTFTAPSFLTNGTAVVFSQSPSDFTSSGSFSLSTSGDQILAYQGDESSPVLIYGLNIAGAAVWQSDAGNTNTSALPAGLINGQTAAAVQEFDNVKFGGSTSFSSPTAALISISDQQNWLGDDVNRYDLTTFGDFSLPVQLSSFTVRGGDHQVILQWVTESEKDNAGFEIQRAGEREGEYLVLASYIFDDRLKGRLNSTVQTRYTFTDELVVNDQTYWYQLTDVDVAGRRTFHGPISATPRESGNPVVNHNLSEVPESFHIYPNFPNPFNPRTTLSFEIPSLKDENIEVTLSIYDVTGQLVGTLYRGKLAPGRYSIDWDATSGNGPGLPTGVYYAVFRAGYYAEVIKMVFSR